MRVNYRPPVSRKEKKKKRVAQAREELASGAGQGKTGEKAESTYDQLLAKGLTTVKRKQIFKKHKRKDV